MANNTEEYVSILSKRALSEISASWEWYEERQIGLGDRFSKEVTKRLLQIESNPDRYPSTYRNYHSTMIDIFLSSLSTGLTREKS